MTAPTLPPQTEAEVADVRNRSGARNRPASVGSRIAGAAGSVAARIRRLGHGAGHRPVWVIAPIAALWAAAIGLAIAALPMLVVWMTAPQSQLGWQGSLHGAGLLWAVAHGAPAVVGGVTYSLLPWGMAIVPVLLLGYAGGWAARRSAVETPRALIALVVTASAVYGALVGAVAVLAGVPGISVEPLPAAGYASVMSLACFGFGAVRAAEMGAEARSLVPAWAAVVMRAGAAGALVLLGLGAVAASASLLVHIDDAIRMAQALQAGAWGGLLLLLLGVGYVPVMVVWSASYLVGAGVTIGPAVVVSPFIPVTPPTQLPPFPLLAALPTTASPLAWALPVAGVVAGVVVGLTIARRSREQARLVRLGLAVGASAVAGVLMLVAAHLASGALGDVRLADVGPSATAVAVLSSILIVLGAVPSAVAVPSPARPRLSVADPGAEAGVADARDLAADADVPARDAPDTDAPDPDAPDSDVAP